MNKTFLKGLLFGVLLAGSAGATARGYYEFIPYYGNDPFLFCTLGVPTDCWAPISAATGTFTVTNYYCFNAVSAAQFARVCPHAFIPEASILQGHDPLHAPVPGSAPATSGKDPYRV